MSNKRDEFQKKYECNLKPLYEPNDKQKEKLYEKFVSEQEEQFKLYINYINEILIILKDYRIVSDFTKMNARIKSTEGAILNDGVKALDDVFGIEVDFATQGEKDFVTEIIKGTMSISKEKIHKKDNGYEARHLSGYTVNKNSIVDVFKYLTNKEINPEEEYKKYYESLSEKNREKTRKEENKYRSFFVEYKSNFELYAKSIRERMGKKYLEELMEDLQQAEDIFLEKQRDLSSKSSSENRPLIEFQSKTIQVAINANLGEAKHEGYKGITSVEMQKEYDRLNGKVHLSQVPTMYTSDLKRDDDGNVVPMKLRSSQTTLERLYPGLITGRRRKGKIERGGHVNI